MGLLIVAAAWWLSSSDSPSPLSASASESPQLVVAPVTASLSTSAGPVAESANALATTKADDEIEVCGGQWLKLGTDGQLPEAELAELMVRTMDEVSTMALAAMRSGGSPAAHAAASYFRVFRAEFGAHKTANCASPACVAVLESWQREGEGQREALAQLAASSDDPQTYAWAYHACRSASSGNEGSCLLLNAARWAQLDPANAEPWRAVAAEAHARKDRSALDDAMFHIASADRHDPGMGALAAQLLEHLPPDDAHLFGTTRLLAQASYFEGIRLVAWSETMQYCHDKELGDANRRETCERIAAVLASRSTALFSRAVGEILGKRVGWPVERIEAGRLRRDAERTIEARRAEQGEAEPLACGTLRAQVERMRGVARYGEVEFLRREVAATGKSVAELAAEGRRLQAPVSLELAGPGAAALAASAAAVAVSASGTNVALGR
jgi:hypothetical protein